MNYSSPKFNKEQLAKQKRHFINNAYNQIAYIQRDCKSMLYKLKNENWKPITIDTLLKFVCITELQPVPFLDNDYYLSINFNPKGRYVVFPCGEVEIYNKETQEKLDVLPSENKELIIICKKYYVIETALFNNIEQVLRTLPLTGYLPLSKG